MSFLTFLNNIRKKLGRISHNLKRLIWQSSFFLGSRQKLFKYAGLKNYILLNTTTKQRSIIHIEILSNSKWMENSLVGYKTTNKQTLQFHFYSLPVNKTSKWCEHQSCMNERFFGTKLKLLYCRMNEIDSCLLYNQMESY